MGIISLWLGTADDLMGSSHLPLQKHCSSRYIPLGCGRVYLLCVCVCILKKLDSEIVRSYRLPTVSIEQLEHLNKKQIYKTWKYFGENSLPLDLFSL